MYTLLKLNLHETDFSGENINLRQMKTPWNAQNNLYRDIESRNIVLLYIETRARGFYIKFNVPP